MPEPRVIILAAGESRRMGKARPLLPLGGESVLERVIRIFVSAGLEPFSNLNFTSWYLEDRTRRYTEESGGLKLS